MLGVQIEFENQAENTQRTFRKTLTLCPVIHYSSHADLSTRSWEQGCHPDRVVTLSHRVATEDLINPFTNHA